MNISDCAFPSEPPNIPRCCCYQMLHNIPNINIPLFLLHATNYRQSETVHLCSHLVLPIETNNFSNRFTHWWFLTSHLLRTCNKANINHARLMFGITLLNNIISLNFECLFRSRKCWALKRADLHQPSKIDWNCIKTQGGIESK